MRTFKDLAGRDWGIAMDIAAAKRVRDMLGLDIVGPNAAAVFEKLIADPITLCDVLFAVCRPQAERLGVSDEEFGRALAGDVIERAARALLEELADFTPHVRDRERARRIVAAIFTLADRARDVLDRQTDEAIRAATESISGAKSGSSPGSSDSTPARCRCEN